MEENIAILMADLSGYTALTETHGAFSAADLIDKYLEMVAGSLVGDCKLNERTGDEVMIVSNSPDSLLASAVMLMKAAATEENFLQVHGGLHYGKVLRRHNSYFGATINLTSRIAGKAPAGHLWCSQDFVNALNVPTFIQLQKKGKHQLKNVSEGIEMYELNIEKTNSYYIDPVCRMLILNPEKAISCPDTANVFFCSPVCLDIHKNNQQVNE